MNIPLNEKEIKKQSLILEFYETFNMDNFGAYIYKRFKDRGLAGGKLVHAPNGRDIVLTLHYGNAKNYQIEELYLNVFDVFGAGRHKREIKLCLHEYYIKMFGNEYKELQQEYEIFKRKNKIENYKDGNEILLQPWAEQ